MSVSEYHPSLTNYLDEFENAVQILVSIDGHKPIPALLDTIHYWIDSQVPLCDDTELLEHYDQVSNETTYIYNTSILTMLANKRTFQFQLNEDKQTFIEATPFEKPPKEFKGIIKRDPDRPVKN